MGKFDKWEMKSKSDVGLFIIIVSLVLALAWVVKYDTDPERYFDRIEDIVVSNKIEPNSEDFNEVAIEIDRVVADIEKYYGNKSEHYNKVLAYVEVIKGARRLGTFEDYKNEVLVATNASRKLIEREEKNNDIARNSSK